MSLTALKNINVPKFSGKMYYIWRSKMEGTSHVYTHTSRLNITRTICVLWLLCPHTRAHIATFTVWRLFTVLQKTKVGICNLYSNP